jgi:hypothetical protein
VLILAYIPHILACHLQIDSDADPDPACHIDTDADLDLAYHFTVQFDTDPCGSGFTTMFLAFLLSAR